MGDLVIRIESGDRVPAEEVAAAVRERVARLDVARFGTGAAVEVATTGGAGERLDPATAIASVTVLLTGLTLSVSQARKLLDEVAGLLRSANGVKQAYLELAGGAVKLADAGPGEVVAELED